jgi:NAD(P)-dependent dehydrogenase (short-subunit alcohol dehydrogenase family)
MSNYQGKTAIVTGGSTGIGFATAKLLVQQGASVLFTARSADAVAAATKELGPKAFGLVSDASKLADIDALVAKARSLFSGGVDFLFVNAGIAKFLPLEAVDEAFFDETISINTKGAFFTIQKLAPTLNKGAGVVLNTSVVDEKGMAGTSVYAASKAALRSLARSLSAELLPKGIRVNAVSPGPISTPIYDKLGLPAEARAGFETQMREGNPMKRFGQAEEVARAALFLGFDATYTTGAELPVDGGLTQL